jgi:hypothetical protein
LKTIKGNQAGAAGLAPDAASAPKTPPTYKNQKITVVTSSTDKQELAAAIAQKLTRPEVSAAGIIENWQKDTHDVNELVTELARQIDTVNGGDLARAEGILIAQAHALDNIFANLARRATNQEYLKQWDGYMRMAMKAQNQCRMTLETLATIKNPPVVYAKQANINNGGQQQVNNGNALPSNDLGHVHAAAGTTHAGKPIAAPTELLGTGHELLEESGASQGNRRSESGPGSTGNDPQGR